MTPQSMDRRRFLLFASLSSLVGLALLWTTYAYTRDMFVVRPWDDYLGEPERRALGGAVSGSTEQRDVGDALKIQECVVDEVSHARHADGEVTTFHLRSLNNRGTPELMDALVARWKRMGMQIEGRGGVLTGLVPDGPIYAAGPDDDGLRIVCIAPRSADGLDDADAGVLPDLPEGRDNLAMGRVGRPGYTMLFTMHGPVTQAVEALEREMFAWGWQPFEGTQPSNPAAPRQQVRTYRHQTQPLGCQVIVQRHADMAAGSRAFIALF